MAKLGLQVAAVRALLSHGAEVDPVIPRNGNSPLHVICKKTLGPASADDAVAIIKLLVGRGADLGAANGDGDRPLHLAVMSSGSKVRGLKLRNFCRTFFRCPSGFRGFEPAGLGDGAPRAWFV